MKAALTQVIIYGGAFNPPTIAHTEITQELINRAREMNAEVWIMPSGERKDKSMNVPIIKRLAYIAAMLESCSRDDVTTRIERGELESDTPTETIMSVRRLACDYPEHRFTWVFGVDSVQTMGRWRGGQWMFDHLDMLLVARKGFALSVLPPRAQMLEVNTAVTSSTEVRQRLAEQRPITHLVSPKVHEVLTPVVHGAV